MTKTTCDSCGKELKGGNYCYIKGYSVKDDMDNRLMESKIAMDNTDNDWDLCRKCYKAINKKICQMIKTSK